MLSDAAGRALQRSLEHPLSGFLTFIIVGELTHLELRALAVLRARSLDTSRDDIAEAFLVYAADAEPSPRGVDPSMLEAARPWVLVRANEGGWVASEFDTGAPAGPILGVRHVRMVAG